MIHHIELPDNAYVKKYRELVELYETYIQEVNFDNDEGELRTELILYHLSEGTRLINEADTYVDDNLKFYRDITVDFHQLIQHVHCTLLQFRTKGKVTWLPYFDKPHLCQRFMVIKYVGDAPTALRAIAPGFETILEAEMYINKYLKGEDV